MIELIFVIVILGILASVAIPRLAATREDAEISAAVANLRTLVSDATAYYTAKGSFNTTGDTKAKWSDITNVPLTKQDGGAIGDTTATTNAYLKVGNVKDCIDVQMAERQNTTPAHIKFTKKTGVNNGVCKQVLDSDPLKAYFTSTVTGVTNSNGGAIAIGSSTSVYQTTTPAKN